MKKYGKNGFVLAEAIVVGVFLISLLSILIINVLPLVGEYEKSFNYDKIERKYDVNLIRRMILLANVNFNSDLDDGFKIYSKSSTSGFAQFCNKFGNYKDYCDYILSVEMLDVKTIIISDNDISKLKQTTVSLSRGLREYIKYLKTNKVQTSSVSGDIDTDDVDVVKRRLIVEFKDNTYASIEVPYE